MCGPHSALGLEEAERQWWPHLRERLRPPGALMAMMRGVLGSDAEVAVVVTVTPDGVTRPVAMLVTAAIAEEITLTSGPAEGDLRSGLIGEYPVEVLLAPGDPATPIAVMITPWIFENLNVYSRKLWSRRR